MDGEALVLPGGHDLSQAFLNAQFLVGRGHNVRDGLSKVVQLHGKQVGQSEGLGVHVEILASQFHQLLPVPEITK